MSMRRWKQKVLELRARLVPEHLGLGWLPMLWLGYLSFLFFPILFGWIDEQATLVTLATIPVFLWLYFRAYRSVGLAMLGPIAGMAMLAFVLQPFNSFANTYMVYVAASAAFLGSLSLALIVFGALLIVYTWQVLWLGQPAFIPALTFIVGVPLCIANWQWLLQHRKDAQLRLSHDEVRRLAQLAERERIGRDLHDLLGHTLSLIALKAELARKLFDRDAGAARTEIADVERVARQALAQVRRAVTGIRAAAMAPELASARLLLDGAGIEFSYQVTGVELPPAQETCMALVLREAVTNVQRHARAARVEASLRVDAGQVILTVVDDGRGGAEELGNGLRGMAERVSALGGELRVVSPPGHGTRLVARLPLPPDGDDGTVTPLRRRVAA